ncbi:hypothetical protein CR513_55696, partial [Mucuna pruriens]
MLAVRMKASATPPPVITFSERDMRVLIDQGSSTNILYWLTYRRLGLPPTNLEVCSGTLYRFIDEQVMIKGVVELETTFGECSHACSIPVLYTVVDVEASYNIIIGRPALNKLRAVVSTLHLCMKYSVGQEANHRVARWCYEDSLQIGSQPVRAKEPAINILDLDLDPRCEPKCERPLPTEDLKEIKIKIGPSPTHKTRIGIAIAKEEESRLVSFLWMNRDVFAWAPVDMPGIDLEFMCHCLSVLPTSRSIAQRRIKLGEEKRKAAWEETCKLLAAWFIREIQYPTWLANVVMVKKANDKWHMCTDYIDLNKACPKDPYPLPNINWLVDRASGFALLCFMDAYSGYNQIRLHPCDEAKTAFITDSETFCYKVMPFGLKIAGAMY